MSYLATALSACIFLTMIGCASEPQSSTIDRVPAETLRPASSSMSFDEVGILWDERQGWNAEFRVRNVSEQAVMMPLDGEEIHGVFASIHVAEGQKWKDVTPFSDAVGVASPLMPNQTAKLTVYLPFKRNQSPLTFRVCVAGHCSGPVLFPEASRVP